MNFRRGPEVTSQSPCYVPTIVQNTRVNCLLQSLIQWSLSFLPPSNDLVDILLAPVSRMSEEMFTNVHGVTMYLGGDQESPIQVL